MPAGQGRTMRVSNMYRYFIGLHKCNSRTTKSGRIALVAYDVIAVHSSQTALVEVEARNVVGFHLPWTATMRTQKSD